MSSDHLWDRSHSSIGTSKYDVKKLVEFSTKVGGWGQQGTVNFSFFEKKYELKCGKFFYSRGIRGKRLNPSADMIC